MKPKILLRITAFLILFFAVGHTLGHFTRKVTTDPVDKEVIRQMEQHKFNVNGSMRSWDDFYEGISLNVSITLLVFTAIFWILANSSKKYPEICYKLLWPSLFCFIGFTITGFFYIFVVPTVTGLIICILIIFSMIQLRSQLRYKDVIAQPD